MELIAYVKLGRVTGHNAYVITDFLMTNRIPKQRHCI